MAAALIRDGLEPGQTAAMLIPNTPHFPICFFALMRAGIRTVLLSPLDSQRTIQHKIADSGARTLVTLNVQSMLANALALKGSELVDRVIVADHRRFGPDDLACADIPPDEQHLVDLEELCKGAVAPQA